VVLAAPIGEELFFRGFLFAALRARHGFWSSALLSSAAFGLVHVVQGSFLLVPIIFVVGLGLAWVYERRGSLLASITAHATFNAIGLAIILALR
jgi:CAAX protease family protein